MPTLEKMKEDLRALTELLSNFSDQMNDNPYLEKNAEYMKDINILLDEILKIKKEVGTKQFNSIKYVLKEKYPKQKKRIS